MGLSQQDFKMQRFNKLQPAQETLNILFINVCAHLEMALF